MKKIHFVLVAVALSIFLLSACTAFKPKPEEVFRGVIKSVGANEITILPDNHEKPQLLIIAEKDCQISFIPQEGLRVQVVGYSEEKKEERIHAKSIRLLERDSSEKEVPNPIDRILFVDSSTAQYILHHEANVKVIDIRSEKEFKKAHLKEAIRFSPETFVQDVKNYKKIKKNDILLICSSDRQQSAKAARKLKDNGYSAVYDIGGPSDFMGGLDSCER